MSDTVSLPPSYQEPPSSGPAAHAQKELLVQGVDEPGTITFSHYTGSRTPLYRLVKNEDGGIDLLDVSKAETIYTVQAEPGSKTFTATRLATPSDSADSAPAATSLKPEKISRAGGFIYKASFPNPHLEGTRCVWKGSIFQSVELYAKETSGQRTPIANYVRKAGGDHFLRLHSTTYSNSSSSSSSAQTESSFPSLPLIICTLYPFLQLYWKYTRTTFTSEKKLNEWSASAQPSKWDSRILGKAPSAKGKERGRANGNGSGTDANGVHASTLPLSGKGGEGDGASYDADEKTLRSSSDEGGYDSDDDLKAGGGGKSNGLARAEGDAPGGRTSNTRDGSRSQSPGTGQGQGQGQNQAGKSPSRLSKLFGRRGD